MKKIITAIGEKFLNEELKKYEILNVVTTDIQYKEGILEVLENEKNIDIIIFYEGIQGNIDFEDLIDNIRLINRNVNIIIILDELNEEKNGYLKSKNINNIFLKNNLELNKIINIILNNFTKKDNLENEKIENNNKILNNYFKENKNNLNENYKKEKINIKLKNNIIKLKKKKENKFKKCISKIYNIFKNKKIIKKVITISGVGGVGKSIFAANLANAYSKGKNKILIIDFDILNNCIHTLYGVNKYPKNIKENLNNKDFIQELCVDKINIKKLIIKINNKIDLISGIDIILNNKKIDINELNYLLEKLKEDYNLIIIDTSTECFFEYTKMMMKCSDNVLFLLEGNLLQIKKSINLLNIYTNNWCINCEKINLIINKKTTENVEENILKNIFSDYYIIGNINFSKIYNKLINRNMNVKCLNNKIKKEYKVISQKILKENNVYKFNIEKNAKRKGVIEKQNY